MIMTHGWPGSIIEFNKVIGPLTDPVAYGGDARDADKNAAYPKAIDDLIADQALPKTTELQPVKYLNNIVELSASIH